MSCGMYINYAILAHSLKTSWMKHYEATHQEEQQLPVFILEGINDVCHRVACLANGDPLNRDVWVELNNLSTTVIQSIDMYSNCENSNKPAESSEVTQEVDTNV